MEKKMDFQLAMQCLNDKRWDDLKQLNLPAHFRSNESPRTDVETKFLSEISKKLPTNLPRETEIIFLKTLINSCCRVCDQNSQQDDKTLGSIKNQLPYEAAIKHATDQIIKFSETNAELDDELLLKLYLKFICNFLTLLCRTSKNPFFETVPVCLKNPTLKMSVINLTQHSSEEVATISCIFCYNALTELVEKDFFNFEEQLDLLNRYIKSYTKIGCDAAEEGIVHMINIPTILKSFYECANLKEKKVLMEITRKHFDKEKKCPFPDESVLFLIQRFNKITDKVTLSNNIKILQTDEPEELSGLLDLLLHMCSCDLEFLRFVQKNKSFLINCVGLLKMLHLTGKSKDSFFSPVDYTKEMMMASKSDDNDDNSAFEDFGEFNAMVYGFKSKLVRTVGNLSHLNKENQDLIREMEGLAVIMDCCILDAKNPLIKECAIYAIRNLCENNLENQEQIHKTVKMENDSTQILEKMGLTLQDNEDGGGIRIAPIKRK